MRGKTVGLYRIIYSFHMPAFLFLNGRLAKFDNKKVFKHLIIPYFVFQTLYLSFDAAVMKDGAEVTLQYTTPYWILWYLMVIIIYYILIPMLPPKGSRGVYTVLPCSFLLALLAGYDKTLGYYLSLSRASVFAPYFLFGYYYDDIACRFEMMGRKRLLKAILTVSCLLMICLGEYYIVKTKIPHSLLYGSLSYERSKADLIDRCIVMITAGAWIVALDNVIPDLVIPCVTSLGENTMTVYLFHAFIIRIALKYKWLKYSQAANLLILCVGAFGIMVLFGNRFIKRSINRFGIMKLLTGG